MDKTKIAVDVFDKRANEYHEKYMDTGLYHDTFDLFCGAVATANAAILEIACGPGNITRYLGNKRPDFRILGTDLSPNMLRLAKLNNPEASFQLMDAKDIGKLKARYDGIMCGFCLPYLSKEEALQFIRDAAEILNPGGALYLSTMEDDYSKSGIQRSSYGDELYMYFHEAGYLTEGLQENGFKILDLRRQDFTKDDGTKMTDLIIIAVH